MDTLFKKKFLIFYSAKLQIFRFSQISGSHNNLLFTFLNRVTGSGDPLEETS